MNEMYAVPPKKAPGLLVSVRSAEEALRALEGGASIIDIKEPLHGPLGRATDVVIQDVVRAVDRARPVSAALGEWAEEARTLPTAELAYVKWGLAGCQERADWRPSLHDQLHAQPHPRLVLTAYADWECARAPSVEEIFTLAQEHPGSVLLIDTHCKEASKVLRERPTLLDWLPIPWIGELCQRCRTARVRIALAGSLGAAEIQALLPARPDWFAVRGAVCAQENRCATIQADQVRRLVQLLETSP